MAEGRRGQKWRALRGSAPRCGWGLAGPGEGAREGVPANRRGLTNGAGGLAILLAAAVLSSGCAKKEAAEVEQPAPVQVTAVTQAAIHNVVAGDGIFYPYDQASVQPKISAPVEKFYVNRGDHVKKGQLLAELEHRDLSAELAEGEGAREQPNRICGRLPGRPFRNRW